MSKTLSVRDLEFGTLYRIVFWAGAVVWILIAFLLTGAALLAPSMITVNGVQANSSGEALISVPIVLVLGAVASALFAGAGAGLLRVFGRFLPLGQVRSSGKAEEAKTD